MTMSVMNMMSTNMSIIKSGCKDCSSVMLVGPDSVVVISPSSVGGCTRALPSPSRKAAAYGVKMAVYRTSRRVIQSQTALNGE